MDDFLNEQLDTNEVGEATLTASGRHGSENSEEGILTVDVYQTEDEIVIKSTIAGVGANDIDISITKDIITIKGKRQHEEKVRGSDYYYQEIHWGSFSRSIILPEEIDPDKAKASMKSGLLTLHLPKLSKNKTRKLRIAS